MKYILILFAGLALPVCTSAQPVSPFATTGASVSVKLHAVAEKNRKTLLEKFDSFDRLSDHSIYTITLAADVPDDSRPMKVYYKKEPGHVFVILEKKDTISGEIATQSWGFYPVRTISCIFFRRVKCKLSDNGGREYNAGISQQLTKMQFDSVKARALHLSAKKYSMNKYNCYDYALELFNASLGIILPAKKVKFPFILGRGGSPCGLYKQLAEKIFSEAVGQNVHIGRFNAPISGIIIKTTYAHNNFY